MKKLYHKYCKESKLKQEEVAKEIDVQQEYARQREYLERTVISLRKKQVKDQFIHRLDNVRIMQENVVLITEINHLRRDVNSIKQKERSVELALKNGHVAKHKEIGSEETTVPLPALPNDK